jgi:hypothetical protein
MRLTMEGASLPGGQQHNEHWEERGGQCEMRRNDTIKLISTKRVGGVVHAYVGQKVLKRYIILIFSNLPCLKTEFAP